MLIYATVGTAVSLAAFLLIIFETMSLTHCASGSTQTVLLSFLIIKISALRQCAPAGRSSILWNNRGEILDEVVVRHWHFLKAKPSIGNAMMAVKQQIAVTASSNEGRSAMLRLRSDD